MNSGTHHQPYYNGNLPKVLVLGGWSPGPLTYLQHRFRDRCAFIEPEIPMPFFRGGCCSCCCNLHVLFLVAGIVAAWYIIRVLVAQDKHSGFILFLCILFVLATLILHIRLCIAFLVRSSIRLGTQIAKNEIHQRSTPNDDVRVIIGFSWGGGVLANFYCHHQKQQDHQDDEEQKFPSMIFLAPTTSPMSLIALQKDPPLYLTISPPQKENVHVFHATNDGFCPYPERWERTGATTHMCRDNHVFQKRSSQQMIGDVLESLLSGSSSNVLL
mmetsp:Transcript_26577/g.37344  ORF Transcript_26577/g.37344 Transcript_26577/m.37344 type:complete len:271 (+) Transcript_26577:97-909(+)